MALTNRQFEKILQEYDETRQENERAARARYEEACEKIPALRKLDGEIAKTGSEAAQYAVTHGEVMPDFSDRMNALSDKRARLLTDAGYPADYTEIRYRCPLCRDTGFAGGRKCACLLSKEAALLRENYNADSLFADETFAGFRLEYYPEETDPRIGMSPREAASQAYRAARYTAEHIRDGASLLLRGSAGLGKTFLSNCIAHEALDRAESVVYLSATDLFARFEKAAFQGNDSAGPSIFRECDLLIIDDHGTELTNSFVEAKLFYLVNERSRRKKATVISTNLSISEIRDRYSDRISSRILLYYDVVYLFGSDIRILKKQHT